MECRNTITNLNNPQRKQKQSKIIRDKKRLKLGMGFGHGDRQINGNFQIRHNPK